MSFNECRLRWSPDKKTVTIWDNLPRTSQVLESLCICGVHKLGQENRNTTKPRNILPIWRRLNAALSSFFRVRNGCLHFLREDAFPFGYVGLGDDRHADRSHPACVVATTMTIRRALNQSQVGDPACLSLVQCEEAWNHSGGPAIAELPSRQCPGAWPTAPW